MGTRRVRRARAERRARGLGASCSPSPLESLVATHALSPRPARTHTLTGSLCPHSLGQYVVPSMVAGAVDDSTSSLKYARLIKLDPSKAEDFRAWAMTLKASLSTAASSALELGKPTRAMAILLAPKGASEHTVDEIMGELWNNYYSSQLEVWRAIVQCTDFTKSAAGHACMETLDRMFGADHDGMAAYDWMCRRYDN